MSDGQTSWEAVDRRTWIPSTYEMVGEKQAGTGAGGSKRALLHRSLLRWEFLPRVSESLFLSSLQRISLLLLSFIRTTPPLLTIFSILIDTWLSSITNAMRIGYPGFQSRLGHAVLSGHTACVYSAGCYLMAWHLDYSFVTRSSC